MKFVKWISLFFVDALLFFCIGFYYGFKAEEYFYPGNKLPAEDYTSPNIIHDKGLNIEPVVMEEEYISQATKYVVRAVMLPNEELSNQVINVPLEYIGMNRDMFLTAIENFSANPPEAEIENGFVGAVVNSFSGERVKITMYYEPITTKGFYVGIYDHQIVVYEEDQQTIFIRTGIIVEELSEDIQQKLIEGFWIQSEEELYRLLEAYSS